MADKTDAESLPDKVSQKLKEFSETVDRTRQKFSKLFSEVLHIPLNDHGSIKQLKMFGSLYDDDFASHLNYLIEMGTAALEVENADICKIFFGGNMALSKIKSIDTEAVKETTRQITELKELASKFKQLKEDQKKAFEGLEKKGTGEENTKAIMSKLKAFIAEEAREAFFESELETDPGKLLDTLGDIESSLQDVCKVTCEYKEVLQKVVDRMSEVKSERDRDTIVAYISGIQDGAWEIVQECKKLSKSR